MYKRIAVHVGRDDASAHRMRVAIQLAQAHEAQLIGIYPAYPPTRYLYDKIYVSREAVSALESRLKSDNEEVEDLFGRATDESRLSVRFLLAEGFPDEVLATYARYCDLLVLSQDYNAEGPMALAPHLGESLVMSLGRPVLMVPKFGDRGAGGRRVLLCWNGGREAARAMADADPILKRSSELVILMSDWPDGKEPGMREQVKSELAQYIAAHGYPTPRFDFRFSQEIGIGNTILNTVTDYSCDLVVMGAYGHSRIREWSFGGASRTVLHSMTVPVLFSH
jgi:nucleotide-binding universal stress UspA family protein